MGHNCSLVKKSFLKIHFHIMTPILYEYRFCWIFLHSLCLTILKGLGILKGFSIKGLANNNFSWHRFVLFMTIRQPLSTYYTSLLTML